MLRVARITIHARAHGDSLDEYRKQLSAFISGGDAILSDGGKLRMREVLTILQSLDASVYRRIPRLHSSHCKLVFE